MKASDIAVRDLAGRGASGQSACVHLAVQGIDRYHAACSVHLTLDGVGDVRTFLPVNFCMREPCGYTLALAVADISNRECIGVGCDAVAPDELVNTGWARIVGKRSDGWVAAGLMCRKCMRKATR